MVPAAAAAVAPVLLGSQSSGDGGIKATPLPRSGSSHKISIDPDDARYKSGAREFDWGFFL